MNSKHRPRFLVERSQCVSTTLWCTWKSHTLTNGTRKTNFREFNCQIQVLWNSFQQQQKIWGLVFPQNDSISELPRPLQLNPSSSWLWLRKEVTSWRSRRLLMAELELNQVFIPPSSVISTHPTALHGDQGCGAVSQRWRNHSLPKVVQRLESLPEN